LAVVTLIVTACRRRPYVAAAAAAAAVARLSQGRAVHSTTTLDLELGLDFNYNAATVAEQGMNMNRAMLERRRKEGKKGEREGAGF